MKTTSSNSFGPDGKSPGNNLSWGFRLGIALAIAVACLWGICVAWGAGASRLLTYHGKMAQLPVQTESAIQRTPDDPEAHSGSALVLLNRENLTAALPEYEHAIALRPRDYFLWLELGRARDMNNDEAGALAALAQSVKLAPEFAEPRWQLGNVLFRAGRFEEAFEELRRAALSDALLLPNFIDLAWGAANGDPVAVEQIVRPEKTSWRTALAKYFIKRGRTSEALVQFRLAGGISTEDRQLLLSELIKGGRYRQAYEVWLTEPGNRESDGALIVDGGFENKMSRTNTAFGWQVAGDTQYLSVSLDANNPRGGAQSLRVDFKGESSPLQSILKQLVIVEPDTHYRLSFNVRVEEIVSGGLPLITVRDASANEDQLLAQSPLNQQTSGSWQKYLLDLRTAKTTDAIIITLRRQNCSRSPCPIFGRLWLDEFILQRVAEN